MLRYLLVTYQGRWHAAQTERGAAGAGLGSAERPDAAGDPRPAARATAHDRRAGGGVPAVAVRGDEALGGLVGGRLSRGPARGADALEPPERRPAATALRA